ncbi:hypothetical protein PSP6_590075 [Paraburkholderia tropica]|nr:hypothetical protein PSP6_590075 [Paraburkholderia tropica]
MDSEVTRHGVDRLGPFHAGPIETTKEAYEQGLSICVERVGWRVGGGAGKRPRSGEGRHEGERAERGAGRGVAWVRRRCACRERGADVIG